MVANIDHVHFESRFWVSRVAVLHGLECAEHKLNFEPVTDTRLSLIARSRAEFASGIVGRSIWSDAVKTLQRKSLSWSVQVEY